MAAEREGGAGPYERTAGRKGPRYRKPHGTSLLRLPLWPHDNLKLLIEGCRNPV
jgi:hypothetical protein